MGLPEGSSSRICLPPLPQRCRCGSALQSRARPQLRWGGLRPQARCVPASELGFAPVGHELACSADTGLVQQEAQAASREARETGCGIKLDIEAETPSAERDRLLDIIDLVTRPHHSDPRLRARRGTHDIHYAHRIRWLLLN